MKNFDFNKIKILQLLAIVVVLVLIGFTLRAWYNAFTERQIGEVQPKEQLSTDQAEQQRPEFERGTFKGEQAYLKELVQKNNPSASSAERSQITSAASMGSEQVDTSSDTAGASTAAAPTRVQSSAQQTKLEELRAQQEASPQSYESQQSRLEALSTN